jgi:hypothetical protein
MDGPIWVDALLQEASGQEPDVVDRFNGEDFRVVGVCDRRVERIDGLEIPFNLAALGNDIELKSRPSTMDLPCRLEGGREPRTLDQPSPLRISGRLRIIADTASKGPRRSSKPGGSPCPASAAMAPSS